jgi:uncharacterized protein
LTPDLPPLVLRTIGRLICAFEPERIVVFGSYAKETVRLGSDVDLLVVANISGNPATYLRRARQLAADCFPSVDVVFATPFEIADAANAKSPFLQSILGTGITVYARGG